MTEYKQIIKDLKLEVFDRYKDRYKNPNTVSSLMNVAEVLCQNDVHRDDIFEILSDLSETFRIEFDGD